MRTLEEIFGNTSESPVTATQTETESQQPKRSLEEIFGTTSTQSTQSSEQLPTDLGTLSGQSAFSSAPEQGADLPLGQRFNLGVIRKTENDIKYLQQLYPKAQISMAEDGRIRINDTFVDPKNRQGWVNFFRDNAGRLTEFLGDTGFEMGGQIAADIPALASGVGAPGIMAANAAGAAGGSMLRQQYAQNLIGEKPSIGETAIQGAMGAASVPVAKLAEPVTKGALRAMAWPLEKVANKFGDAFPSIAESLQLTKSYRSAEYLMDQKKLGRKFSEILTDGPNGNNRAERIVEIVDNTFLGGKGVQPDKANFLRQYQTLMKQATNEPDKDTLRAMYKELTGLSDRALNLAEPGVHSVSDLMNPKLTQKQSWNELADEGMKAINANLKFLKERSVGIEKDVINNHSSVVVPYKDIIQSTDRLLEDMGIKVEGALHPDNPRGTNEFFEDLYQMVERASGTPVTGSRSLKGLPPAVQRAIAAQEGTASKPINMSLKDSIGFRNRLNAKVDDFVNRTSDTRAAKAAIAFKDAVEQRIFSKDSSGAMKAMNERLSLLNKKQSVFNKIREGYASDQMGFINKLKQASRGSGDSVITQIEELDQFLPVGKKIAPKIHLKSAAEEWQSVNYADVQKKFSLAARSIHGDTDASVLKHDLLKVYDSAIKNPNYKFLRPTEDHLAAISFGSNKQNVFRTRIFAGMLGVGLGAGFTYSGQPLLGAAGMGLAFSTMSPKGLARVMKGGERVVDKFSSAGKAIGSAAGKADSTAGKALISRLLASSGAVKKQ